MDYPPSPALTPQRVFTTPDYSSPTSNHFYSGDSEPRSPSDTRPSHLVGHSALDDSTLTEQLDGSVEGNVLDNVYPVTAEAVSARQEIFNAYCQTEVANLRGQVGFLQRDLALMFRNSGRELSSTLTVILRRTLTVMLTSEDRCLDNMQDGDGEQPHPFWNCIVDLCSWVRHVGQTMRLVIEIAIDTIGYGDNKHFYLRTKEFSLFLWWRVCKISTDTALWSLPYDQMSDELIRIEHIFVTLVLALERALREDIADILQADMDGDFYDETGPLDEGTVSIKDLFKLYDVFDAEPPIGRLPASEMDHDEGLGSLWALDLDNTRLGSVVYRASSEANNSRTIDLKTLIGVYPLLTWDWQDCLMEIASDIADETTDGTGLATVSSARQSRITARNHPWQIYLHKVMAQCPVTNHESVANEVWSIYVMMKYDIGTARVFYARLSTRFSRAPSLLQEFKAFVPSKFHERWNWAEAAHENGRNQRPMADSR